MAQYSAAILGYSGAPEGSLEYCGYSGAPEGSLEHTGVLRVQLWAYVMEEWFRRKTSHSLGAEP